MSTKKPIPLGLSITPESVSPGETWQEKLTRVFTGAMLLVGLWGMSGDLIPVPMLLTAAVAMGILVLPDRRGGKFLPVVILTGGVTLALLLLLHRQTLGVLSALGSEIAGILTAKTGYYYPPFAGAEASLGGMLVPGMLLGAVLSVLLYLPGPVSGGLGMLVVMTGILTGILRGNLWLGLYFVGMMLLLGKSPLAGVSGKVLTAVLSCLLILLAVGGAFLSGAEFIPSGDTARMLHEIRYETDENPLPEGNLSQAGRRNVSPETALEITMDSWQSVYLRGFVGTEYTGSGWEETPKATLGEQAQLLFVLQRDYFFPQTQLASAAAGTETQPLGKITVKNMGACRAYAYLPAGIGDVSLDPRELNNQRLDAFTGTLYPLADAYLLQKELSDGAGETTYRYGEAAYREYVYSTCLTLDEEVRALLSQSLGLAPENLTTTQVKELILAWLNESMRYDEYGPGNAGEGELLTQILRSKCGYSFHYATLGVLAMRYYGIPARYAEGYLVTKEAAAGLAPGQTLQLPQSSAHGWVEYYLDGVGWIPFEVTPGYEQELVYHLPPDGSDEQEEEPEETQPPENDPPVKQEPNPGSQTRRNGVRVVAAGLMLLLILAVLAMMIRAWVLRSRLKRRLAAFEDPEDRQSLLDCLSYQFRLLSHLGLTTGNRPLMALTQELSQILPEEQAHSLLLTAQELYFSSHPVTEDHRKTVLSGLETIRSKWTQTLPKSKRFRARWIDCDVL